MDQFEAWDRIGASFDETRTRTWPHVDAFLDDVPTGGWVLDVMCGNGRHLRPGVVGLDWSRDLCRAAKARSDLHHDRVGDDGGGNDGAVNDVVRGDATAMPFADGTFDAAIYVAGLHGIPKPAGRIASLRELRRVVHPGGRAQVTVWSREAPRFAHVPEDGPTDVVVPWRRDGHDVPRTYHLYTAASLAADCRAAGWHAEVGAVAIAADAADNLVATLSRP